MGCQSKSEGAVKIWKRCLLLALRSLNTSTAQKMKFSIKDLLSKCDQIRRNLRIWSNLLKKSLMENLIFCAVSTLLFLHSQCKFSVCAVPTLHFLCSVILLYSVKKSQQIFHTTFVINSIIKNWILVGTNKLLTVGTWILLLSRLEANILKQRWSWWKKLT